MDKLCIIPCGNKKIWSKDPSKGSVRAEEAYIGTFHRLCKSYARLFFNNYVILSAKHGFLRPQDHVDEMYNLSFSMKNSEIITVEELQVQFNEKSLASYKQYVVLTGKKYQPILQKVVPNPAMLDFPLIDCKGIGFMQQRLKKSIDTKTPIHKGKVQ